MVIVGQTTGCFMVGLEWKISSATLSNFMSISFTKLLYIFLFKFDFIIGFGLSKGLA